MNLIDVIPIGKKHKEPREALMCKINMYDTNEFRKQLADLRKQYIILYDEGYYLPSSQEEYWEFIQKLKKQVEDIEKTISLAYKEMEEKEYV